MLRFQYNSYHKLLIGLFIAVWAGLHFTGKNSERNYYENKQVKRIGSLINGKNHGLWTWYYENGNKKMEGTFLDGKRNDIWTTWDINGQKIIEGYYEKDVLNGPYIRWNENGDIIESLTFENDILIHASPTYK